MARDLPKNVYRETDRHGRVRVYYRAGGKGARIALPDDTSSQEFSEALDQAKTEALAPTPKPEARKHRATPGTLKWLCHEYMRSSEFLDLDPGTQRFKQLVIDHCLEEPIAPGATETFGDATIEELTPKALRVLRDRKSVKGLKAAANNRVKVLRTVFAWALSPDVELVSSNPMRDVPYIRYRSDGHHSWTLAEIKQYRERHPIGTTAYLALDLFLYLGQRRSDIHRVGEPMMRSELTNDEAGRTVTREWIEFRQFKNRNRAPIDLSIPIHPELRKTIKATKVVGEDTWLVTEYGEPFSAAGLTGKMRDWCDQAKLYHCTPHGLRKAHSARLAERNASDRGIMSMTGHQTSKEIDRYTKAARQRVMAAQTVGLLDFDKAN